MTAQAAPSYNLSLDLSEFTPVFAPGVAPEADPEALPVQYEHACRCSSLFVITEAELEAGVELIQCQGCTERCKVEYEVMYE